MNENEIWIPNEANSWVLADLINSNQNEITVKYKNQILKLEKQNPKFNKKCKRNKKSN